MKKFLTVLIAIVLVLSLSACGGNQFATNETTSESSVDEANENAVAEEKLEIELVAGEQGKYGTPNRKMP